MNGLGRAMRILRTIRGLTQRQLAVRVNIDVSYVSLIEEGKRQPSVNMMRTLAEGLKVSYPFLVMIGAECDSELIAHREQRAELALQLFGMLNDGLSIYRDSTLVEGEL